MNSRDGILTRGSETSLTPSIEEPKDLDRFSPSKALPSAFWSDRLQERKRIKRQVRFNDFIESCIEWIICNTLEVWGTFLIPGREILKWKDLLTFFLRIYFNIPYAISWGDESCFKLNSREVIHSVSFVIKKLKTSCCCSFQWFVNSFGSQRAIW